MKPKLPNFLKWVLSAFMVMFTIVTHAQTDVTATYLTNPNFNDTCNYLTTDTGDLITESNGSTILDVTGWGTGVQTGGFNAAATFEYGTATTLNGVSVPATGPNAESGTGQGALGFSQAWGGKTEYRVAASLPKGFYTISYSYYNVNAGVTAGSSLVGFVPDSGTASLSALTSFTDGAWTTDQVSFTLTEDTAGSIQVGVQAINSGSDNNAKVFFDDVQIMYTAPTASLDASLSNLATNVGNLSPTFDSNKYDYNLLIPAGTTTVNLTATTNDLNAFAFGDGPIDVSGGDTIAIVTVIAEAGNTQDYTVRISENYLFNQSLDLNPNYLVADSGNLAPANDGSANLAVYGWDLSSFEYSTSATFEYGTGETMDNMAVPATDANGASVGAALGIMSSWSANIRYSQHITLPAGTYSLTYKGINVNPNGNVGKSLAGWIPDSGTPEMSTIDGGFTYNNWVNDEIIFAIPAETSGSIQLGMLATTHSGPEDKAHMFFDHVNLQKLTVSADATLASLTPDAGSLSPAFDPSITEYFLHVPAGTLVVNLNPVANDTNAAVSGDTTVILSGDTIANIVVTAEFGNTQTYRVFVYDDLLFDESFDMEPHFDLSASGDLATANGGVNVFEAPGWTKHYGDNCVGATYTYGTSETLNGGYAAPTTDANGGSTGASYAIQSAWGASVYYTQPVTLPAGNYKISYKAYNAHDTNTDTQSVVGFIPDSGTATMSSLTTFATGTWTSDEILFTLTAETTGTIQIGVKDIKGGSGSNPRLFFDSFVLEEVSDTSISTLSDITVGGASLIPSFTSGTKNYVVSSPNGATSINLNATTTASGATFTINGVAAINGVDASIPISGGVGTATIEVTSEDGLSQDTYTVEFKEECFTQTFPGATNLWADPTFSDVSLDGANYGGWLSHGINTNINNSKCGATSGYTGDACGGSLDILNISIQPNTTYRVIAYVYSTSGVFNLEFSGDWDLTTTKYPTTQTGVWELMDFEVTTGANAAATGNIYFNACGGLDGTGGYIDNLEVYEASTLAVDNFDVSTEFRYSPNPTHGYVILNSKYDISAVSIYSITGQLQKTYKNVSRDAQLDLSSLSQGLYFMRVEIKNQIKVIKLMVK